MPNLGAHSLLRNPAAPGLDEFWGCSLGLWEEYGCQREVFLASSFSPGEEGIVPGFTLCIFRGEPPKASSAEVWFQSRPAPHCRAWITVAFREPMLCKHWERLSLKTTIRVALRITAQLLSRPRVGGVSGGQAKSETASTGHVGHEIDHNGHVAR